MASFYDQARVDALAATATMLADNDHGAYIGVTAKLARETTPFQPGVIVWAALGSREDAPVKVLVLRIDLGWSGRSRRSNGELVDHVLGFVARADGTFGKMLRHIDRGDITRGYEKARALGLHAAVTA